MQTNTLSAFNPSQNTKCAYLINLMTTDAMTKFPKAKPNQHLNTKSTNKDSPARHIYNQDVDVENANPWKNAYTTKNAYTQKTQCMGRTRTPNPQTKTLRQG